jgi:hypothetical protein
MSKIMMHDVSSAERREGPHYKSATAQKRLDQNKKPSCRWDGGLISPNQSFRFLLSWPWNDAFKAIQGQILFADSESPISTSQ